MPPSTPILDRRRFGLGLLAAGLAGRAEAAAAPIVCWGDSLTFGAGVQTNGGRYPTVMGRLFAPPRAVRNAGIGGETSTQVARRMLSDPRSREGVAVIWAGRNNYDDPNRVRADLKAMAARCERSLVLSIINADVPEEHRGRPGYRAIRALNDALRDDHGFRFLDVRGPLVERGLAMNGLNPTAQDRADIVDDVPARTLRADHIHLNDAGQAVIAVLVHDALVARGW